MTTWGEFTESWARLLHRLQADSLGHELLGSVLGPLLVCRALELPLLCQEGIVMSVHFSPLISLTSPLFSRWQPKGFSRDFLDGPVVGNLPSNAGNVGSIPGQGTKIPLAPNLFSIARGPECCNEDYQCPHPPAKCSKLINMVMFLCFYLERHFSVFLLGEGGVGWWSRRLSFLAS